MDASINTKGDILTVALCGELDHHSSEELRDKIDKSFERSGCKHMVFDFSQVTFMDSSGIGMMIGRYKNTEKRGGFLSVAGMNNDLQRIYQISGLAKIIKAFPTVYEAERAAAQFKQ